MAIVEKQFGGFDNGPGNTLYVAFSYDDVDLRVRGLRVRNDTPQNAYIEVTRPDGSRKYANTALAGTDTTVVIPTTVATRIQLTLAPNGRPQGIEGIVLYPWP